MTMLLNCSSLNLVIQAQQKAPYGDGQLSRGEHKVPSLGVQYKWIYEKVRCYRQLQHVEE